MHRRVRGHIGVPHRRLVLHVHLQLLHSLLVFLSTCSTHEVLVDYNALLNVWVGEELRKPLLQVLLSLLELSLVVLGLENLAEPALRAGKVGQLLHDFWRHSLFDVLIKLAKGRVALVD